jgi:hypothetical protein
MEAAGGNGAGNPKIAEFGQVFDCIPRQRLIRKREEEWGETQKSAQKSACIRIQIIVSESSR